MSDINECDEGISGCDQTCTNTNGSYTCSCSDGYVLDADGHNCNGKVIIHIKLCCYNCFHSDLNECSKNIDSCQVHCSNTIGSYNCYCDNGYELLNATHCTGTLYSMME